MKLEVAIDVALCIALAVLSIVSLIVGGLFLWEMFK